jgi:hypothetical protein
VWESGATAPSFFAWQHYWAQGSQAIQFQWLFEPEHKLSGQTFKLQFYAADSVLRGQQSLIQPKKENLHLL